MIESWGICKGEIHTEWNQPTRGMCLSGGKPGSAEVVNPVFSEMELKDIEFSLIDFNIFLVKHLLTMPKYYL